MRQSIKDEFTNLPISRQRKYQLRKARDGQCTECGAPAQMGASRCVKHIAAARERQRKRKGSKRRYNSLSYRIENTVQTKRWRHVNAPAS